MLDVDNFKEINDTNGHLNGDGVLEEVALRIAQTLRSYDVVGRYGGEEFLTVLPGCDRDEVQETAEKSGRGQPNSGRRTGTVHHSQHRRSRCAARRNVGRGNTFLGRRCFVPRKSGGKESRGLAQCCRHDETSLRSYSAL
jgi:GGDEF domain-containing protein